jgi:Ca2+-transporting ATPase
MLSGTLIVFGSLAVFWHARSTWSSVELARTIGFTTPAVGQLVHVFNVRRKDGFGLDRSLLSNPLLPAALGSSLLLQAAAVSPLARVMETRPLSRLTGCR